MSAPPQGRRLDVAATRAAFAAGTLGAIGDDAPLVTVQGNVISAQLYGPDGNAVEHERQSRLARWQRVAVSSERLA